MAWVSWRWACLSAASISAPWGRWGWSPGACFGPELAIAGGGIGFGPELAFAGGGIGLGPEDWFGSDMDLQAIT